jgi:choloylglycine hydrolase
MFYLDHATQPVIGRNWDWDVGDALVVVNKRNMAKTAMQEDLVPADNEGKTARVGKAIENPVSWVSHYGSVTFNEYGRDFPSGGMNEAGLVISALWLSSTKYPGPSSDPALNGLQWIQYHLDTCRTVDEVLASTAGVRVTAAFGSSVHYFVCDATGACASVEFLEGKAVTHTGADMPVKALTNNTYADSIAFWQQPEELLRYKSLARFQRAADVVSAYDQQAVSPVDDAFHLLEDVAIPPDEPSSITRWSIVYDPVSRRIFFQTLDNPQRRYVGLAGFDFSCGSPVRVLDMNAQLNGDVTGDFSDYTPQINQDLLVGVMQKTGFLQKVAEKYAFDLADVVTALALSPESSECVQ